MTQVTTSLLLRCDDGKREIKMPFTGEYFFDAFAADQSAEKGMPASLLLNMTSAKLYNSCQ